MKTQEPTVKELKHELFKQTETIGDVLDQLKKANLVLNHWESEYSFSDKPELLAAVAWGSSMPRDRDPKGQQAHKWFYEYDNILGFINIVSDYVYASKEALEKVLLDLEKKGA